jgi:hypothetical protein
MYSNSAVAVSSLLFLQFDKLQDWNNNNDAITLSAWCNQPVSV